MARDFANQSSITFKRERFNLRREPDDTWTVYDIFSGLVVTVGGVFMMDLNVDVAFYVVDELNDQDFKRRIALGFLENNQLDGELQSKRAPFATCHCSCQSTCHLP